MKKTTRKPGYYRVKSKRGGWFIGYCYGEYWMIAGHERPWDDSDFTEISEMSVSPKDDTEEMLRSCLEKFLLDEETGSVIKEITEWETLCIQNFVERFIKERRMGDGK